LIVAGQLARLPDPATGVGDISRARGLCAQVGLAFVPVSSVGRQWWLPVFPPVFGCR